MREIAERYSPERVRSFVRGSMSRAQARSRRVVIEYADAAGAPLFRSSMPVSRENSAPHLKITLENGATLYGIVYRNKASRNCHSGFGGRVGVINFRLGGVRGPVDPLALFLAVRENRRAISRELSGRLGVRVVGFSGKHCNIHFHTVLQEVFGGSYRSQRLSGRAGGKVARLSQGALKKHGRPDITPFSTPYRCGVLFD